MPRLWSEKSGSKTHICFLPSHMKTPLPEETIIGRNLCCLSKQIKFRDIIRQKCDSRQQQKPLQPHFQVVLWLKLQQPECNNNNVLYKSMTNGGQVPYCQRRYYYSFVGDKLFIENAFIWSPSNIRFVFGRDEVNAEKSSKLKKKQMLDGSLTKGFTCQEGVCE